MGLVARAQGTPGPRAWPSSPVRCCGYPQLKEASALLGGFLWFQMDSLGSELDCSHHKGMLPVGVSHFLPSPGCAAQARDACGLSLDGSQGGWEFGMVKQSPGPSLTASE